jgi:hypothetical protein
LSEKARATVKAPAAKTETASTPLRQHEGASPCVSPYEQVIQLQRTVGNQAVQGLFKSGLIQTKLRAGAPNDIYEQEADRVADQVMRMTFSTGIGDRSSVVGRNKESAIQTKPG